MIFTWEIHTDTGVFLGYEYAISEQSAKEKAFMVKGTASAYTGIGINNLIAKRLN